MLQSIEAILQPNGQIQFLEPPPLPVGGPRRVLITFTETAEANSDLCGATLSEPALAEDWLREEEDAAWAHLQDAR